MSNFFRLFILVDQTSDQFYQPRIVSLAHRADAKLFDQHHFVALRIVRQHAHGIMTHEHFTIDLAAHAPGEQLMSQVHTVELVEALIAALAAHDVDGGRNGVGKVSHEHPRLLRIHYEVPYRYRQPRLRAILTRPYRLMQPLYRHRDGRWRRNPL